MQNHRRRCDTMLQKKNQPNQSKSGKYKQYEDIVRLVYDDNISIQQVVKQKTLHYLYQRLGITGVSFDFSNSCLE